MSTQNPSPQTLGQEKIPSGEKTKGRAAGTRASAKNKEKTEKEIGGFADSGLLEPTRFGDWEVKGRCSDF
ncbi:MAG: DUF1674 domain-containing protein [Rhodospirillales bacterium]|nr:DUF1674 domain-containing protein [Rhodospirillales bacterium]